MGSGQLKPKTGNNIVYITELHGQPSYSKISSTHIKSKRQTLPRLHLSAQATRSCWALCTPESKARAHVHHKHSYSRSFSVQGVILLTKQWHPRGQSLKEECKDLKVQMY